MEKRKNQYDAGSTMEPAPTLDDIGIDKKQSHRWQTEALVSEKDFEKFVAEGTI